MSYTEKVSHQFEATTSTVRSLVAYVLPFYFKHLPERKSGTGIPDWDELNPEQKELHTSIHPTVCNAAWKAHTDTLKANKLDTIIKLAREFDDVTLEKILTTLDITPDHILIELPK